MDIWGEGTAGRGNGCAKALRQKRALHVAKIAKAPVWLEWSEGRGFPGGLQAMARTLAFMLSEVEATRGLP